MSHFTVLVIGENIEEQLQPFHEYECTGTKDQYVVFVKKDKEELLKEWEENKADYPTFDAFITDYHGYEFDSEGIPGRWTNPNSKWDWWRPGGRWSGQLKLKPGSIGELVENKTVKEVKGPLSCDHARKRDIDFEARKQEAALRAEKEWHSVNDMITKTPGFRTWKEITNGDNYGEAQRNEYNSQPEVLAFRKLNNIPWQDKVEDYLIPKETYVQKEIDSAGVTFALVKDYKWYEKGDMGRFAMVSNEKEQHNWNAEFWKIIDSLPDDEFLTVVDCRI